MTADIAQTNLKAFDPIDFGTGYQDGGKPQLPAEGRYFGQAPQITDASFSSTQEGYLKVTLDPITLVNNPASNGYQVRFTNLSAKKYSNREASQVGDFLRACGLPVQPKSNDELKQALKMASGKVFQFGLQWEVYNKATKESWKGTETLEALDGWNKTGKFLPDPFDETKKLYANGKIRYFVSAISK